MYDDDGVTSIANRTLRPEQATTFELVAERRLNRRVDGLVTVYRNLLDNLLTPVYTANGAVQYRNLGRDVGEGVEVELRARPAGSLEVQASFAVQRATGDDHSVLPNSPGQVGKLLVSSHMGTRRLSLTGGAMYLGERRSIAGAVVPAAPLAEVSMLFAGPRFDIQAGLHNALNRRYLHPTGVDPAVDTMRAPGRTFFVMFTWREE
jgi:outer membrane receptor protein involved in Fe transport